MTDTDLPTRHPGEEHLLDYAAGASPEPLALLVATHLAFCPLCRQEINELAMLGGAMLEDLAPETMSPGCLDELLARIDQPVPASPPIQREPAGDRSLPQPLRDYLGTALSDLPWRRRGAGSISEVSLLPNDTRYATRLLWIKAGAAAPRHSHQGSELTLVLKGSFSDGHGLFRRGDVDEADGDIDHQPIAGEDEDCLCLTVIDAPLKLTSPLGRLINPFVQL